MESRKNDPTRKKTFQMGGNKHGAQGTNKGVDLGPLYFLAEWPGCPQHIRVAALPVE